MIVNSDFLSMKGIMVHLVVKETEIHVSDYILHPILQTNSK